jgi:transcriptional regulator with XRE-family HTH domain
MEKSGPRLTANRKQQKALLSLLRQLRMEAGLRQVDMAKALGKPQAFVSYYESGARRLDLLELRQICGILGIRLGQEVREATSIAGNPALRTPAALSRLQARPCRTRPPTGSLKLFYLRVVGRAPRSQSSRLASALSVSRLP